jgi:hypothetical protein
VWLEALGRVEVVMKGATSILLSAAFAARQSYWLFHGFDALKNSEMIETCHLSLYASRGRIVGVVGRSGICGSGGKWSNSSFFLL